MTCGSSICGKVGETVTDLPIFMSSGICRSAHRRKLPVMFKGAWGASPTSENGLGIYPDTARTVTHIDNKNFDFSRISKHREFGRRLLELYNNNAHNEMLSVLDWIKSNATFRLYRRELFTELMRSIRFAEERGITIFEASQQIRMLPDNQSKYAGFKKLSSRAVLSKGLEFECVAINLEEKFTATEMYVAMTRATKEIYFITNQDSVLLEIPQGI